MRDYGKVSPKFWTGATGKLLRGHPEAQIVALYLMTSPHSSMIGVYHLPVLYLAHETGLSTKGASKGLERCIEVGFCTYDEEASLVFVHLMARHQIGDALKPVDKRLVGIRKQFEQLPEGAAKTAFLATYRDLYGLHPASGHAVGCEAPSMPLGSQEQEQEQEQDPAKLRLASSSAAPNDAAPIDLEARKAQRLAAVSEDAIAAYNRILAKPNGLLPAVSRVGREKRQQQVKRCLRVASEICVEQYDGSPTVTAEFWASYFAEVSRDDFHAGRLSGGKGHEQWKPDFEFLTRPDVMLKVFDRATSEAC